MRELVGALSLLLVFSGLVGLSHAAEELTGLCVGLFALGLAGLLLYRWLGRSTPSQAFHVRHFGLTLAYTLVALMVGEFVGHFIHVAQTADLSTAVRAVGGPCFFGLLWGALVCLQIVRGVSDKAVSVPAGLVMGGGVGFLIANFALALQYHDYHLQEGSLPRVLTLAMGVMGFLGGVFGWLKAVAARPDPHHEVRFAPAEAVGLQRSPSIPLGIRGLVTVSTAAAVGQVLLENGFFRPGGPQQAELVEDRGFY